MKFSDGTELRFNRTKNLQIIGRLFGAGGLLFILSRIIRAPARYWVEGMGTLALAAGLMVFLVGAIIMRRASESKLTSGTK
jgi:hypothetical protein